LALEKSQYAAAVVANPVGTVIPLGVSDRKSSPRDAFLPPTLPTSSRPVVSSQTTSPSAWLALSSARGATSAGEATLVVIIVGNPNGNRPHFTATTTLRVDMSQRARISRGPEEFDYTGTVMTGVFGYKDIVVSIDPSHEGRQRAQFAMRLAERHGASLVGYYAAPTVGEYFAAAVLEHSPGHDTARAAVQAVEAADAIAQQFEKELKRRHLDGAWLLSAPNTVQDIAWHARTVDLCILGLGSPVDVVSNPQGFRPDDVILSSGRPVLGLPSANLPEEVGC